MWWSTKLGDYLSFSYWPMPNLSKICRSICSQVALYEHYSPFAVSFAKTQGDSLGLSDFCWFAGLLDCWFAGLLVCWIAGLILNVDLVLINKVMRSHHQRLIRNWEIS